MRLIFAGTPEFSACALQAILAAGHQVELVLTQPDRPGGRGMQLQPSAVKRLALAAGIDVFQPSTLRDAATQEVLRAIDAEAMVVAAYGLILPQAVLDMPRYGCLNIHASLLPRWRGAAPIQRAILAGDEKTGVCIMQMEAGLDTGPVLLHEALPITSDDTSGSLHDKLAGLGARLIVDTLERLPLPLLPQAEVGASYAAKIEKAESLIDWRLPAEQLQRKIRAFNPFPGVLTRLEGKSVKIWAAQVEAGQSTPGRIVTADKQGIVVGCGAGVLRLLELQKAGGKRMAATQFLAGTPLAAGMSFAVGA